MIIICNTGSNPMPSPGRIGITEPYAHRPVASENHSMTTLTNVAQRPVASASENRIAPTNAIFRRQNATAKYAAKVMVTSPGMTDKQIQKCCQKFS